MAGRKDLSIPWPFAPQKIDLNTDTNLLKIIAIVTMLIDHAARCCFRSIASCV